MPANSVLSSPVARPRPRLGQASFHHGKLFYYVCTLSAAGGKAQNVRGKGRRMAEAKSGITSRAANPADEARWRIMWADFLPADDEPMPGRCDHPLVQTAGRAVALRMLTAADYPLADSDFMVYVTLAMRARAAFCY